MCDAYGIFNSNLCRPLDDSMILFKVKTTWWRIKITVFFLLLHFCLFCVSLNIYSCVALATVELFDRSVFPFFSSLFYCTPNSFTCWNIFRLSNGFWNVCSVHPSYAINKSMAQTKTDSIPSIFFCSSKIISKYFYSKNEDWANEFHSISWISHCHINCYLNWMKSDVFHNGNTMKL